MKYCLLVLCVICQLIKVVISKNLHVKTDYDRESNYKGLQPLLNIYDNDIYTKHERYARHVQTITESVLDHLIKEIKKKYPQIERKKHNGIQNIMGQLRTKLQTFVKKKDKKRRKKKKPHKLNEHKHRHANVSPSYPPVNQYQNK